MFDTHSRHRLSVRSFALSAWLARLLPPRRLPPREAFQARFLLGACLLGFAVAVPTTVLSAVHGQWLSALLIGGFGMAAVVQLTALRLGAPPRLLVWSGLATVATFLTLQCLATAQHEPGQLPWLLLLPLCALALIDPERRAAGDEATRWPILIAAVAAISLGLGVVGLKELGIHLGQSPDPRVPLSMAIDHLAFLAATFGLLYLYDRAHRRALDELAALRRYLAVCSWCRKIRGGDGDWTTLEAYAAARATQVTHGICPGCARDHFGVG